MGEIASAVSPGNVDYQHPRHRDLVIVQQRSDGIVNSGVPGITHAALLLRVHRRASDGKYPAASETTAGTNTANGIRATTNPNAHRARKSSRNTPNPDPGNSTNRPFNQHFSNRTDKIRDRTRNTSNAPSNSPYDPSNHNSKFRPGILEPGLDR